MIKRHALALLPAVLVFVAMTMPLGGGFTDDGYIHVQYAYHLNEYGEYSFNRGEPSFGTTSPLWVLTLAAIGSLFEQREALVVIGQVLSWLAGVAALFVAYSLAAALGAGRFTAAACAVVLAGDVWLARWSALGMETSSAALVVLLMALASVRALESTRSAAMFGALAALSSLIRPEVYLALPVFVVAAATTPARADKQGIRRVAVALAVAAVLLVPWLAYARAVVGSFLPNTAGAKSGGMILNPVMYVMKLEPVAKIVASSQAVSCALLLGSVLVTRSRSLLWRPSTRFMLLWIVALPAAYVLFDMQILSRYLLIITPVLCVVAWASFAQAAGHLRWPVRKRRGVAVVAAAVAIATSGVFYARVVVPPTRAFSHDLTRNMRGVAEYLREHSPPQAVVAAADIGYLAFFSERRVLDLGGLVEPVTGELRAAHTYEEIVERGLYFGLPGYPRVDYFIDRDLERDRFAGKTLSGHRFEKVYETTVRNLGIRKPGPYYYTLYAITPVEP